MGDILELIPPNTEDQSGIKRKIMGAKKKKGIFPDCVYILRTFNVLLHV